MKTRIGEISDQQRRNCLSSLQALSVGDAFGEAALYTSAKKRMPPGGPWRWTDDTHMALSIVEQLLTNGRICQDELAQAFASRWYREQDRGYAGGTQGLLGSIHAGKHWRSVQSSKFPDGSCGNGSAMRVAPLGAFFAGDPGRAAEEAAKSAEVTHSHPQGIAGAIAVAIAAEMLVANAQLDLEVLIGSIAPGGVRSGIESAIELRGCAPKLAASRLGTGLPPTTFNTVPWCLWVVDNYGHDFEDALWVTLSGAGDRDTTCAIVAGILGGRLQPPAAWLKETEALPRLA